MSPRSWTIRHSYCPETERPIVHAALHVGCNSCRSSAPLPDTVRYSSALQPIICGTPQTPRADGLADTRRPLPVISSHPAPARPSHPSSRCQVPFLVALGPVIFARNAEADRSTAAAQAHGQLGGCSTIGGGSSPPPLDDLDPSPKAEVNGEPTAKLVSVPRAKVSGESSRRRNVCNLGDDEFLSLRRQKTKILRGASGTNTQRDGQSCCTLGPGSRCSPTAIPIVLS
ncbi:hypothetical protein CPAR01_08805 [Colletotrichum paranaense]|uniref:Uncharacterized protein n=1 Tax=Colletotrichum paranaense TaxID=1914294 RepID=A0ABQ9SF08_9PEZI|nr:uncharacterized protein CPAR01_08805 [Colletotrichum paranaense]KAK1535263.1 hypothetical protein CPAR01_08805 [Colletotrichum paranaense]